MGDFHVFQILQMVPNQAKRPTFQNFRHTKESSPHAVVSVKTR